MSTVVFKYLVALLILQMHACNARHTFDLIYDTKVLEAENTKLVHQEIGIKGSPIFEDIMYTSSDEVSNATLENKSRPSTELQGMEVKGRSILMVESKKEIETKEATNNNNNNNNDQGESAEDAVVMDYVHPRRKSPIHNHH